MSGAPRTILSLALMTILAGCGGAARELEQRGAVEAAVQEYLHALAQTYSTFNLSHLEGVASPNEIEAVELMLKRLSMGGDRLEARLLGTEIDGLEIFRGVNATVRLTEVWDITRFDAFSGREKGRNPSSVQETLLQLRRVEGRWIVVGRSVLDRTEPEPTSAVVIAPEDAPKDGAGE
jgi:hypothetical protein